MMQWAVVLDVVGYITEASRTYIELTVDLDMPQAVAMEAHLIKVRMVWGYGGSFKVASPMSFTAFNSS